MKTLNTTIRTLLATALLGIATLAQAALCITGPAQGVPGTGFTPFASLERLEVRAGRPGNQDWEWGLGTNTQQAGQFITAQLNWVNDHVYSYTLTYNGAGAATLTVSDGSTTLFTRSWATGMDTGNALRFYIKANAGIGAGNRISTTITAINGQAVNESLATSGNNLFEEQARFFTSEGLRTGFTVEGTVKLTFTGSAPPQGSRLNLMVNAGNIACETQANAQLYFIHTDHLNTPRLITNTVGLPVWRWDNDDPYGNNAPNENPSGAGNFTCNLRLPGQYFDAELNTHYNYFRDYDPVTGRYVQSDPIGLAGGINTYAYVGGNPISYTDPTGLETYQCRRPLGGLPGADQRSGPEIWFNPFYHQYSCTRDANGKLVCGGQGFEGSSWWNSPGKPTTPQTDYFSADACKQTQGDNKCFEQCLIEEWGRPRPRYGIPFGTNCQQYDNNVNSLCRKKCGLK